MARGGVPLHPSGAGAPEGSALRTQQPGHRAHRHALFLGWRLLEPRHISDSVTRDPMEGVAETQSTDP